MFPDLTSMSLAGWSNQFVDESLWDCDDAGSNFKSPTCHQSANSIGLPENSLVSLFRQNSHGTSGTNDANDNEKQSQALANPRVPTVNESFSPVCRMPKSPPQMTLKHAAQEGIVGKIKANRPSTTVSVENRVAKTHNVINEVLKNLSQVINLDDAYDDIFQLPVPQPVRCTAPVKSVASCGTSSDLDVSDDLEPVVAGWNPTTVSSVLGLGGNPATSAPQDRAINPYSIPHLVSNLPKSSDSEQAPFSLSYDCNDVLFPAPPAKKQRLSPDKVPSLTHPKAVGPSSAVPDETGLPCLSEDEANANRFRDYQNKQWGEAYEELLDFRRTNGNCQVPHGYLANPPLSRWVKRQRYQYKLMMEGKPSTMTDERIQHLESVGFVWDSHNTIWEQRIAEIEEFRRLHGHVTVPSTYKENMKLATWVKQQRRQYKLFSQGRPSNITLERIEQLQSLGFEWSLRTRQEKN